MISGCRPEIFYAVARFIASILSAPDNEMLLALILSDPVRIARHVMNWLSDKEEMKVRKPGYGFFHHVC